MPLLAGDIRFARSSNMADVPEGGGPPSAKLLTSGRSNEIFPDLSEETRTVGRVEIYQIHSVLRNADRTPLLGSNTILAQPPADPNISMTLLSLRDPFATRADIVQRIESGMSPGTEFSGFLLENHFETMRSMTLFQRPGTSPPTIGRTYLLVWDEGKSSERRQRVRIKAATTEQRMFTEIVGGHLVEFLGQVTTCELFDGLSHDFPGSPPTRFFARAPGKALTRETVYSDSGMFYGASPLAQPTLINDVWLRVASVYTQIVPNSRTEVASVDQYPGARQTLTLASTPREVKVGITPHTQRIRIAEENAGRLFVALLKPAPAAGTVFIDFWSLGNRYTLTDDGEGRITGQGSGSINYLTGALQLTLKHIPDIGSSITITHGAKSAYTNRAGQAGFRAPEFAWQLPHQGLKPGSVVVTWLSGGVLKTAADNGTGGFTSASGAGEIDYATGKIYLRPTAMIDAGGEFSTAYEYSTTRTENFNAPTPDAGGFGTLTLADSPAAKSVTVRWITVRNVSASSGTSEIVSKSGTVVTAAVGAVQSSGSLFSNGSAATVGQSLGFTLTVKPAEGATDTYSWEIFPTQQGVSAASICAGGATTGTFLAIVPHGNGYVQGTFALAIAASAPVGKSFVVRASNSKGEVVATSTAANVVAASSGTGPNFWFGRANIVAGNEDGNGPLMAYGAYALPGELLRGTLDIASPNTPGTYSWHVEGYREDTDPASLVQGGASTGTFTVSSDPQPFSDVIGKGEFTFTVATNCPTARFSISVKNQSGDYVGHSSVFQVYNQAPPPPPEQPPQPAIQTREPISTGSQASNTGTYISGMYQGGVDGAGKRVFVAVLPQFDRPDYGAYYDPPASATEVWTEAQLAYGKQMASLNGKATTYMVWK